MRAVVNSVEIILNTAVEGRFAKLEAEYNKVISIFFIAIHLFAHLLPKKYSGLTELKNEHQTTMQRKYMTHLLGSENFIAEELKISKANPITAWHGVNENNIKSIAWYGLLNLSKNDDGNIFFLFSTSLF